MPIVHVKELTAAIVWGEQETQVGRMPVMGTLVAAETPVADAVICAWMS